MTVSAMPTLLTVEEVAQRLGTGVRFVRRTTKCGRQTRAGG